MNILTQEYATLYNRQEAIKQEMLGIAASIEKLDNSSGKKIAAEIANKALNVVGVPIKIPAQLGYIGFGLFGFIPAIAETKKMVKYASQLKELETEFNQNALKLQESEKAIKLQEIESKAMFDSQATNNNGKNTLSDSPNSNNDYTLYYIIGGFLFVIVVMLITAKK